MKPIQPKRYIPLRRRQSTVVFSLFGYSPAMLRCGLLLALLLHLASSASIPSGGVLRGGALDPQWEGFATAPPPVQQCSSSFRAEGGAWQPGLLNPREMAWTPSTEKEDPHGACSLEPYRHFFTALKSKEADGTTTQPLTSADTAQSDTTVDRVLRCATTKLAHRWLVLVGDSNTRGIFDAIVARVTSRGGRVAAHTQSSNKYGDGRWGDQDSLLDLSKIPGMEGHTSNTRAHLRLSFRFVQSVAKIAKHFGDWDVDLESDGRHEEGGSAAVRELWRFDENGEWCEGTCAENNATTTGGSGSSGGGSSVGGAGGVRGGARLAAEGVAAEGGGGVPRPDAIVMTPGLWDTIGATNSVHLYRLLARQQGVPRKLFFTAAHVGGKKGIFNSDIDKAAAAVNIEAAADHREEEVVAPASPLAALAAPVRLLDLALVSRGAHLSWINNFGGIHWKFEPGTEWAGQESPMSRTVMAYIGLLLCQ